MVSNSTITDVAVTSFAHSQFGEQAPQVVQAVVSSMAEAQTTGCQVQKASRMSKRHPYGSVWPLRYELLVQSLRDLEGVEVVATKPAIYELVRVNGRLLVPFKLASSLADIPRRPRLSSEVLRARAAQGAPKPEPDATLFDDLSGEDDPAPDPDATERAAEGVAEETEDSPEPPPVFIGVVANADSDTVLAIYWGIAVSISEDGVLEWAPESMPLQLAPAPRTAPLSALGSPGDASIRSFRDHDVPDLTFGVRDTPLDTPPPTGPSDPSDPSAEGALPRPTGEQDG